MKNNYDENDKQIIKINKNKLIIQDICQFEEPGF